MNISVSVEIDSPKDIVWAAITDFDNCMQMISAIIDLKVIDRPEAGLVGFKWTETREMFGKQATETMWITECHDGDYYCARAENCGAIYLTKMSLVQVSDKTQLTMSFSGTADSWFKRLLSSLMGVLFKKSMAKMLEKDLNEIKAYVEKANNLGQ